MAGCAWRPTSHVSEATRSRGLGAARHSMARSRGSARAYQCYDRARGSLSPSSNQQEETPMYRVPDVDEVMAVAKELGIHLGPEEVGVYRKYLLEALRELDGFVQARLDEPQPPMTSAARAPGYRPSPEEDPLNAWTWKCRIEGAGG